MSIPNNYIEYRSPDGKYVGYFETNKAPSGWLADNEVLISTKEFMDYFYNVDTLCDDAVMQTYDYFQMKYPNKQRIYENRDLPKESLINLIKCSLLDDSTQTDILGVFSDGYMDWQFIDSLASVWEEFTLTYEFDELLLEVTGGVNLDTFTDDPETFFINNNINLE